MSRCRLEGGQESPRFRRGEVQEGLKSIQFSADLLSARFKHTYPETL